MLRVIIWNVRGIANNPSRRRVNHLFKKFNLHGIVLLEPKDTTLPIDHYRAKFKCQGAMSNTKNSIWCFWKDTINITLLSQSDQHISMNIIHGSRAFTVTSIYA